MAKKLSDAAKTAFISEHKELVPRQSRDMFDSKPLDKQYTLMCNYVRKANEKNSVQGKVKQYLKSTNSNPEVVKDIINICSKWLEKNKVKVINDLAEQIKKLQEEKEKYENL